MPSNHLILCHPVFLPPSIFPSIRVFSNESVLHIRWPKYRPLNIFHTEKKNYLAQNIYSVEVEKTCLKKKKKKKQLFSSGVWAVLGAFPQAEAVMSTDSEPHTMNIFPSLPCHPLCLLTHLQVITCSQRSIKLQLGANKYIDQGCSHSFSKLHPKEKLCLEERTAEAPSLFLFT